METLSTFGFWRLREIKMVYFICILYTISMFIEIQLDVVYITDTYVSMYIDLWLHVYISLYI